MPSNPASRIEALLDRYREADRARGVEVPRADLGPTSQQEPPDIETTSAEPGAFGSVLRWLDRPGQAVRNIAVGDFDAAVRHLGDFVLEPLDAAIIGVDAIDSLTRNRHYTEASDVLKTWGAMPEETPWYVDVPIDIVGGIASDPLTYLTLGAGAGAKGVHASIKGARAAIPRITGVAKAAKAGALQLDDVARVIKGASKSIAGSGRKVEQLDDIAGGLQEALRAARSAKAGPQLAPKAVDDAVMAARSVLEGHSSDLLQEARRMSIARLGIPFSKLQQPLPITQERLLKIGDAFLSQVKRSAPDKVKKAVKTAIDNRTGFLYDFAKRAKATSHFIRGSFGAFKQDDYLRALSAQAQSAGQVAANVENLARVAAFQGIKKHSAMDKALQATGLGIWKEDGVWRSVPAAEFLDTGARVRMMAAKYGVDPQELADKYQKLQSYNLKQMANMQEAGLEIIDPDLNYWPDAITGMDMGDYATMGGKVHKTPEDLAAALNAGEHITAETSAIKAFAKRGAQTENIVRRSKTISAILGRNVKATREEMPGLVNAVAGVVDHIATRDPDAAKVLEGLLGIGKGSSDYNVFAKILQASNRFFKPAATFGALMPRMGYHVGNKMSQFLGQVPSTVDLATKAGRRAMANAIKTTPGDLYGSFADGLRKIGLGTKRRGTLAKQLRIMDEAYQQAGGSVKKLKNYLKSHDKHLFEAVDNNVLDGFVTTEGMLSRLTAGRGKVAQKLDDWWSWPAEMAKGMEDRMRLGTYLSLRESGFSVRQAADTVSDAMLDYSMFKGNSAYRTMRTVVPFFSFTAQSIPQQSQWMMRHPAVAVALAQLYGHTSEEPVMPWIAGQASVPMGKGPTGEGLYATTFRLPAEALDTIPNISDNLRAMGEDFRREWVGSSHPLLKSLYGMTTGEDPFFGSTYGGYSKTPYIAQALGAPEKSELARLYRVTADAGLIQPLATLEQQLSRATDPRMTVSAKVANMLTGMRVAASDPHRAVLSIIRDQLSKDPHASTYEIYTGGSEKTDALIDEMRKVRKQLKAKQEAAKRAAAVVD